MFQAQIRDGRAAVNTKVKSSLLQKPIIECGNALMTRGRAEKSHPAYFYVTLICTQDLTPFSVKRTWLGPE